MFYVDTHAHLDLEYENGITPEKIVEEALKHNVEKIITVSSDKASIKRSFEIATKFHNVYHSMGLHPHDAKYFDQSVVNDIRTLKTSKCVAIGETGLDYYYDHSPRELQQQVFTEQIKLASELQLPIIVHVRDADEDAYRILRTELKNNKAVLHCYSGSKEQLTKFLDLGMYVSFTGIITFPKAELVKEAAMYAPNNRIMLETDSPFLAPVPFRGKKNYPKHIPTIAQKLAAIRKENLEAVAEYTSNNACAFFNI